jgi:putative DNA primase/helicase
MRANAETCRQVAQKYIRAGLAPVPVPPGKKAPNLEEWQRLRISEEEVPRFWNNGQNIRVLTGEPSGWLVDIDLDVPEAITMARWFLPPTLTSGRESKRHSHWWYRA